MEMIKATNLGQTMSKAPSILTQDLMIKWHSIKPILKKKYITSSITITPVQAEKYKFDLEGLFSQYIGIEPRFIFPNVIINDYDSYNTYYGEKLTFNILDTSILDQYYKLFMKK